MESPFALLIAAMLSAVGLGIGASTLAIASFLTALQDGKIDPSERRMLGVIYWTLRWAMVSIVATVAAVGYFYPGTLAVAPYVWILMIVLIVNAVLMTLHKIPVWLGPGLQAATWYTLGFMFSIDAFDLLHVDTSVFLILYAIDIVVVLAVVNAFVWWFKKRLRK
jgi:hypothetical protein